MFCLKELFTKIIIKSYILKNERSESVTHFEGYKQNSQLKDRSKLYTYPYSCTVQCFKMYGERIVHFETMH